MLPGPTGGTCGPKPGWSSLSLCEELERWRGEEKGDAAAAGEFGRERGEMGGGGAVTERQSNRWRLGRRDGDEEREEV